MLEDSKEHVDESGNVIKFCNNDLYTAIMDEDLECIENITSNYGINSVIKIQEGAPGQLVRKCLAILPLHLAASYRRSKSMQKLLSAGAEPEIRDHLSRTALHLVITGWLSIGTPKSGSNFWTTVTSKCSQSEACLRHLCEHGADVNAKVEGESHETALHLSVRYKALSAIHILANYGADINAVDGRGMTPLHMAAGILHKEIITSLIKEGADINKGVKHSGNTPLHLAAVAITIKTAKTLEDNYGCISELLEQGAEVDVMNRAGMTPLQEACSMGNKELVDLLLRYGADINKLSKAGENCLFLFLDHRPNVRHTSLLVKLLSLTSPLRVYDQNGHLPSTLMLPCFFKQKDQLLKLIQQPKSLQDICKRDIYLKYVQNKREELKGILPEKLYDFIFDYGENLYNISFVTDDKPDSFDDLFHMTPS